ncbi:HAD-like domain-containing protein [Cynara cardunculus var. scolymus]|uniref:Sucrose-phosphatase n=1 Tax=Cynara cardunculus var. scolymus TaxID=59895 RepID=A0A103YHY1_CYNCS|nr:HAD-like domain-containing protein [Cynara cardunculus var. scolymus]
MNRLKSPARLMIVSDLDHTMVDHHDPENLSLLRFNALWETKYRHDSLLVFSTGRSPTLYKQLRKEHPMLTPDITIMSVGTEITYGNAMVPDEGWVTVLNHKWDKKIVTEEASKFPELTLQSETEQRPHKASFYVKKEKAQEVMKNLSEILVKRGVKNAQEELLQWHAENAKDNPKIIHADERCAAGIIQAIGHFKLGPSMSPRDLPNLLDAKLDHFDPAYEAVKFYLLLERWQRAEMQNPEHYLDYLKGVCVCSVTFTAIHVFWSFNPILIILVAFRSPFTQSPLGAYINPFGVEQSLHDIIGTLKDCSGDKKGKQYRVWVDQVFPVQIDSDTWLVKFKKLEQTGVSSFTHFAISIFLCEGQQCCFTTAILSSKVTLFFLLKISLQELRMMVFLDVCFDHCCLQDVKPSQGFSWVNVHQTWMDDELTTSGKNWYL